MEPKIEDGTKLDAMPEVDSSNLWLQRMNIFQFQASKSTQAKDREEVEEEVVEEEELLLEGQKPLLSVVWTWDLNGFLNHLHTETTDSQLLMLWEENSLTQTKVLACGGKPSSAETTELVW